MTPEPVPTRPEFLDHQLRMQARSVARNMDCFKLAITRAKAEDIHVALGFKSWPDYIADVIHTEMGRLPVDDRRTVVALLSGEGMSERVIGNALGVNRSIVARDKAAIEAEQVAQNAPPVDLDRIAGSDSKSYPRPKPKPPPSVEVVEVEVVEVKTPPKSKPDIPAPAPEDTGPGSPQQGHLDAGRVQPDPVLPASRQPSVGVGRETGCGVSAVQRGAHQDTARQGNK